MSEDTIIALCFTGASVFLIIMYVFFMLLEYVEELEKDMKREYVEYDTPECLQKIWGDDTKIKECSTCGLDDQPTLEYPNHNYVFLGTCQWCIELSAITTHLKEKGVRRHRSRAS